jgi:hypothetical protein
MLKLVAKDFRISRLFWGPAVFSYFVFLFMFYESAWLTLFIGVFLASVLPVLILLIDDFHRTEPLYAALPVTRRDIVLARFLTTGAVTAVCLALFYLGTGWIMRLLGEKGSHLRPLMAPRTGLAFVAGVGLLMSAFLPVFFRHGLGKAVLRFTIAVLGGSVILTGLLRLFEPGLLAAVNRGKAAAEMPAQSGPALVVALLSKVESSLGGAVFAALVLALTALAVWISARLSIRFYCRRDL